ncbi:hypothetical protein CDD80_527 [Ophiocordyceps camponoti-rufipedis]|uniref:Uncharacterized protein n=1 Tax=Ophiocordyceps camponoti-rufipedis TaxID=2004952 RepID=A0A2C5Z6M7_9HYPO|nr:hypothetical protein CDD80_527 [Ophiocordyceps camponoti-rufipedis]
MTPRSRLWQSLPWPRTAAFLCLWILAIMGVSPVALPITVAAVPSWSAHSTVLIPVTWMPEYFAHDAKFRRLKANCPSAWSIPAKKPLIMASKRVPSMRMMHDCAPMRLSGSAYNFDCSELHLRYSMWCQPVNVATVVRDALPEEMLKMMLEVHGIDSNEVWRRIFKDLQKTDAQKTRLHQLRWIGDASEAGTLVCWPRQPGFEPEQFQNFFGYLGGLFTNPKTLLDAVPQRVMEYPPGHINKSVYHQLDWRSYRGVPLQFQLSASLGIVPTTAKLRAVVDKWSGALGRVILASLITVRYQCPSGLKCQEDDDKDCSLPIKPTSSANVLSNFMMALALRMPFVISWEEAEGSRPPGLWVVVHQTESAQ